MARVKFTFIKRIDLQEQKTQHDSRRTLNEVFHLIELPKSYIVFNCLQTTSDLNKTKQISTLNSSRQKFCEGLLSLFINW